MKNIDKIRSKLNAKGAYNTNNKQLITDWLARDCIEQFKFGLTLMPKKVFAGYFRGKKKYRHLYKQELETATFRFIHLLNQRVLKSSYIRYHNKLPVVMTIEGEKSYKDLHAHFALNKPSDWHCNKFARKVKEVIEYSNDFWVYDPNYIFDKRKFNEKYRYKLDITNDGWLYYITKELDKHNLHNLYLP